MKEKVIIEKGCVMLRNIEYEEDLAHRPGMRDNPPPEDVVCDCCLRPITQLKPFKVSDPEFGDIDDALLVRTWREDSPFDEESLKAVQEACECYENDGYENILDWLVDKYGKEKGEDFYAAEKIGIDVFDTWECLDCVRLNDDEYFDRYNQALKERDQAQSESHDNLG
jgi:hypothetical protein